MLKKIGFFILVSSGFLQATIKEAVEAEQAALQQGALSGHVARQPSLSVSDNWVAVADSDDALEKTSLCSMRPRHIALLCAVCMCPCLAIIGTVVSAAAYFASGKIG